MIRSSSWLIAGCSDGSSLAYHHQAPARASETGVARMKDSRQPKVTMSHATTGAVTAAPNVSPVLVSPFGSPQPDGGNHRATAPPDPTGNMGA